MKGKGLVRIPASHNLAKKSVKKVERVYFYSAGAVSAEVRQSYLQEAYRLGKEYYLVTNVTESL